MVDKDAKVQRERRCSPPNNTKYIPIKTYNGSQESDMAVTDIQVVDDTPYCKIGDNAYLWKMKQALKLTDDYYKMYEVYPNTYDSMTVVPDALDTSELTTTSKMFCDVQSNLTGAQLTQEEFDAQADTFVTRKISGIVTAPEMNTSNITDMSYMLGIYGTADTRDPSDPRSRPMYVNYCYGCTNLTTVPEYDTSKVVNFQSMFAGCTSLPKIFPWTIRAKKFMSLSYYHGAFNDMFSGSSVEEVTFRINTAFYAKAWFDNKDPLDFFRTLDQENGLKKVTVLSGISDDKVVIDNDGVHYYGLSANN